jgi:DNA-binding NtrC family response regulator
MMNDPSTGAMQNFRAAGPPGSGTHEAGLVLLYAEGFLALPSAFPLSPGPLTIGREAPADLLLPVSAVSRRHAEIRLQRGQWLVKDLGSTNGTLVDGQRITEAVLEPNAELRIGDAIFKLVERGGLRYGAYGLDGRMARGSERATRGGTALVGGLTMDQIAFSLETIATSALSVLILGESGTGKEVAARELHEKSGRRGQFAAVNCAALPENLIESELFGYKKGAFSGAERDKPGLVQAADHGTLLLDEIGDMPLAAQAKLLRVLQAREVLPVGATRPEPVDVRVVAATHRDLSRLQREGKFRRGLYARINEFPAVLPPLRDRKEDIYQLVRAFLERSGRPDLAVGFPFMAGLLHHDWPYNVRELEGAIKRAVALVAGAGSGGQSSGVVLGEEHLPDSVRQAIVDYAEGAPNPRAEAPEEEELRRLLLEESGNVAAVGRRLGKARMQVHRWMKRYDIDVEDYRGPGGS